MILGRSTVQWTALITAAGGLAQVLLVTLAPGIDATTVATIIGAVVLFLGILIAFIANTQTTPIHEPRVPEGTVVTSFDPSTGADNGTTVATAGPATISPT